MTRKQKIIQSAINNKIIDNNLTAIGIMDLDRLKLTVNDVYSAFPENFTHTFAVKANALVSVLASLRKYGMGVEVASPGELKISLAAGYSAQDIIFDSPAKTINDLRTCIKNDISLNIDNLQELARIDELMIEFPHTQSIIGFRVNPQIGSGDICSTSTATATSKFGYPLADNNNKQKLVQLYTQRPWLKSIHTHTGSQGCALELMAEGVKVITDLAEEINVTIGKQQIVRLDIGGGLPVNFASEEISPSFKTYADILETQVPILFSGKYQVKTEFGRAIVAKNGMIITRVEYTKSSGNRHIAITHAGAQILTRTAFLPKSWPLRITGFLPTGEQRTDSLSQVVATDVAGPCCFAGDLICNNQLLPKLEPDDYVMVHDTGGYYFSNHFDYNSLPRIGVFAVSGEDDNLKIHNIRKADSLADVLNKM
ncbi:diaminopimelate decarboxylase [Pseudoalteromonas denitrificans]|uniref:Diaminopimelate decarboxylase n=1 Tax=Pseudoalteromonas denitrificans DSM 6059 TaxID=1123010 RepID=A0A1I1MV73_9GAMM|nr:diaminopimelate decarboxylase [Pseudoalteromonas denitrificans]SFC88792.1 diaminopimelate decarboxylase [Pseudoalteromonas denitrificans DSM 6059]